MSLAEEVIVARARLRPHSSSRLMSLLCKLWPRMQRRWMTLGRTIYHPDDVRPILHDATLRHELHHVRQMQRYGVPLFLVLYFLVPLPVGLAYFRWRFERVGYLENIRAGERSPVGCAQLLWSGYGWTWPRKWAVAWFEKHK